MIRVQPLREKIASCSAPILLSMVTLVATLGSGCGEDGRVPSAGTGSASFASANTLLDVFRIGDPRSRARALARVLDDTEISELDAVLAAFESNRLRLDTVSAVELALWWAAADPRGAYEEGPKGRWLEGTLWKAVVIREWARSDPEQATARVAQTLANEAGDRRWQREIVLALVGGWFDVPGRDLDPLLDLIANLEQGRPKKESFDFVLARMFEFRGPDAAIALVERLPNLDAIGPNPAKQDAYLRLATQYVARDPEAATAWVLAQDGLPAQADLIVRMARRWGRDDGARAVAWARALPATRESRPRAMLEAMRGWAASDGSAAAEWIDAQPLSPELEPLLRISILRMANAKRCAQAMARVDRLPEGALKAGLVTAVGRVWLRVDSAGAEAWIREAGLPPQRVAEMRAPPQRTGPRPSGVR